MTMTILFSNLLLLLSSEYVLDHGIGHLQHLLSLPGKVVEAEKEGTYLYLIVPFWYASAAYQASLVEPWFVFWREAVEPKYPW